VANRLLHNSKQYIHFFHTQVLCLRKKSGKDRRCDIHSSENLH
jgi:hypothetical protein